MDNQKFEQMNLDYRSKTDYKLDKTKPILLMLDGRLIRKTIKEITNPLSGQNYTRSVWEVKNLTNNIKNSI